MDVRHHSAKYNLRRMFVENMINTFRKGCWVEVFHSMISAPRSMDHWEVLESVENNPPLDHCNCYIIVNPPLFSLPLFPFHSEYVSLTFLFSVFKINQLTNILRVGTRFLCTGSFHGQVDTSVSPPPKMC